MGLMSRATPKGPREARSRQRNPRVKRTKGFGCFGVFGYWVNVDFGLRPWIHAKSKANEVILCSGEFYSTTTKFSYFFLILSMDEVLLYPAIWIFCNFLLRNFPIYRKKFTPIFLFENVSISIQGQSDGQYRLISEF